MGIGAAKEGFSVYGSLNRCVGGPGKRLLRAWLLRPLVDLQVRRPGWHGPALEQSTRRTCSVRACTCARS